MKKGIILSAIALLFTLTVEAQTAVGARGIFGIDGGDEYGGLEFSIQKPCKYEIDLGVYNESWKATGLKHWGFIDRRNLGLYGGIGIGVGHNNFENEQFATFAANLGSYIMLGHLQMGLDWRPEWNFINAPGDDLSFNLALSARWVFGK